MCEWGCTKEKPQGRHGWRLNHTKCCNSLILHFHCHKIRNNCWDMHYKSHKWRSQSPLMPAGHIHKLQYLTPTCWWIWCPCICSSCWKTDPQWWSPHYSLQCLRTRGTTCDTYKWLACTVCLGQSCCRAWPDGLWSTLVWCNTHASIAQGSSLLFTCIIRQNNTVPCG